MRATATTLAAILAGCGAASPPPSGAVSADLRAGVYQDDDATTIVTATSAVRGRPTSEWTLGARYLVDVTTSASVDVVSAATERWEEARHEAAGSLAWFDGWTGLTGGYVYSIENDWESHTASVGFTQDLDDHDYTIGIGGAFVHNTVWRADDDNFRREQLVASGTASLVAVQSPTSIWSFTYAFSWVGGYQASPYRFARLSPPAGSPLLIFEPESHPEERMRHALTARWNLAISDDTALRSHARAYVDDWGIASLTVGTELRGDVGSNLELGGMVRGYGQLGARFYRDVYERPMRYMTSDRELSPFLDVFAGPSLTWRSRNEGPFAELRWEAKVLGFAFWFPEFSRLETRYGFVAELAFGGNL